MELIIMTDEEAARRSGNPRHEVRRRMTRVVSEGTLAWLGLRAGGGSSGTPDTGVAENATGCPMQEGDYLQFVCQTRSTHTLHHAAD
jgi:hypothetical protein